MVTLARLIVTKLWFPQMVVMIARHQGASPIKVERQITELALEQALDRSNDSETTVRGRVKVTIGAVCRSTDNKFM